MAGLLYHNLLLNKTNLLLSWLGILFMSMFLLFPMPSELLYGGIYTLMMAMICCLIFVLTGVEQQSIFAADERKKWADYISTTPVSVKGQVLSKYYFSLLISIATLIYCNLAFRINAVIQGQDCGAMTIVISLFVFQLCLRSVEFPFLIRFGSKFGNNLRMVGGLALLFLVFVYLLFGDLSIFGTFDDFLAWFTKLMSGEVFSNTVQILVALAPAFAAVLYYLSYQLSCRWYLKGCENYDK